MEYLQLILRNLLPLVFYLAIQDKQSTQESIHWIVGSLIGLLAAVVWNQVPVIHEISTSIYAIATLSVFLLYLPTKKSNLKFRALFEFFIAMILTRNLLSQLHQIGFGSIGTLTDEVIIDICFIFLAISLSGFIFYTLKKCTELISDSLSSRNKQLWFFVMFVPVQIYWLTESLFNWMISGYWSPSTTALRLVSQMKFMEPILSYLELLVFGVYVVQVFTSAKIINSAFFSSDSNSVENRLRQSNNHRVLRNRFMGAISLLIVLVPTAYWDFIGSQPPKLTAALELQFLTDDNIHIKADITSDEDLHRFIVRFPDKKFARFFVINKEIEKLSPLVLLDACQICGPSGYIKKGNYLICLSCHNKIFRPSLGRAGGCNPIPLSFQIQNGEILIAKSDLLLASQHFKSED